MTSASVSATECGARVKQADFKEPGPALPQPAEPRLPGARARSPVRVPAGTSGLLKLLGAPVGLPTGGAPTRLSPAQPRPHGHCQALRGALSFRSSQLGRGSQTVSTGDQERLRGGTQLRGGQGRCPEFKHVRLLLKYFRRRQSQRGPDRLSCYLWASASRSCLLTCGPVHSWGPHLAQVLAHRAPSMYERGSH